MRNFPTMVRTPRQAITTDVDRLRAVNSGHAGPFDPSFFFLSEQPLLRDKGVPGPCIALRLAGDLDRHCRLLAPYCLATRCRCLVTLELLCLERAVLRSFPNRFTQRFYGTVEDFVQLRRDLFDGLEEYYGTLAKTHGYTAEATSLGETLFGINDLFDSVVERLEALTLEITMRSPVTL